jgi:ComF family protein
MTPPLCDRCGDPLPTWRTLPSVTVCDRCRHAERLVDRARAIGPYDGALRDILHALKYEGRRSLARPIAALMRARGMDVLNGAHCLVPVPLHPARRRQRGFNQAADLAGHLGLRIHAALLRTRHTRTQTDLPAAERQHNVLGAFALARGAAKDVSGRVIVLVDDVSTTGATLDACARVLKEAGAIEVRALTAARVVSLPR